MAMGAQVRKNWFQLAGSFIISKTRSRKELTRKNWSEHKCRVWDVWGAPQRPVWLDHPCPESEGGAGWVGKASRSHTGKGCRAPVGKTDFILQTLTMGADLIRSVFKIILKKDHWSQCCRALGRKEKVRTAKAVRSCFCSDARTWILLKNSCVHSKRLTAKLGILIVFTSRGFV